MSPAWTGPDATRGSPGCPQFLPPQWAWRPTWRPGGRSLRKKLKIDFFQIFCWTVSAEPSHLQISSSPGTSAGITSEVGFMKCNGNKFLSRKQVANVVYKCLTILFPGNNCCDKKKMKTRPAVSGPIVPHYTLHLSFNF